MKKDYFFTLIFVLILSGYSLSGQDSLNMTRLGKLSGMPGNEYNDIWGYTDSIGREFAIVGSRAAVNIVNITNCRQPVLDTSYIDGSSVIWRDFKTYKNYVYGVCDGTLSACNEGLQVINMNTRQMVQYLGVFRKAHNIYIDTTNARLYVAGSNAGDLLIYRLEPNPSNPTLLRSYNFPNLADGYIHDLYVRNNIAYVSHGYEGYAVYNVSDPNNIVLLSDRLEPISGLYNHSSWVDDQGEYAYVAFEIPLVPIHVYKLNPASGIDVEFVDTFSFPNIINTSTHNRPHNPFIKGDSMYISYYHDGVQIWDISKREQPKLAAYYDTYPSNTNYNGYLGAWGVYPYFKSGCIVANDISTGLHILKPLPAKVNVPNQDFVIDRAGGSIVFTSPNGNRHSVSVQDDGQMSVTPIANLPSGTKYINTDIDALGSAVGLIMRSPNGSYFRVSVASNQAITTSQLIGYTPKVREMNKAIFPDTKNGIYVLNSASRKVRLAVDNNGAFIAMPWPW